MSDKQNFDEQNSQQSWYEIRLRGHLDGRWIDWFEGMTISPEENGDMLLAGPLYDQAALYGLLKKVRDLGLPLISVNPVQLTKNNLHHSKKDK